MTSKSLRKKLARRIAIAEQIIEKNENEEAVKWAENEIMSLSVKYNLGLEDMLDIDEMVQNILKK